MPISSRRLSSDLLSVLDQCVSRLEHNLGQTSTCSCDQADMHLLIERMQQLKSEIPQMNKETIGTLYALIKRSVYDGAFATPGPGRVYVDFDRIFQRWRTHVLYAAGERKT